MSYYLAYVQGVRRPSRAGLCGIADWAQALSRRTSLLMIELQCYNLVVRSETGEHILSNIPAGIGI